MKTSLARAIRFSGGGQRTPPRVSEPARQLPPSPLPSCVLEDESARSGRGRTHVPARPTPFEREQGSFAAPRGRRFSSRARGARRCLPRARSWQKDRGGSIVATTVGWGAGGLSRIRRRWNPRSDLSRRREPVVFSSRAHAAHVPLDSKDKIYGLGFGAGRGFVKTP